MNQKEKKLAERIIELYKAKGGTIDEDNISLDEELNESLHAIYQSLKDLVSLGLLEEIRLNTCRITQFGWAFESFDDEEKKKGAAKELEQLNVEKLRLEVDDLRHKVLANEGANKRAIRSEWIAVASIILTVIVAALQWICNKPD